MLFYLSCVASVVLVLLNYTAVLVQKVEAVIVSSLSLTRCDIE